MPGTGTLLRSKRMGDKYEDIQRYDETANREGTCCDGQTPSLLLFPVYTTYAFSAPRLRANCVKRSAYSLSVSNSPSSFRYGSRTP